MRDKAAFSILIPPRFGDLFNDKMLLLLLLLLAATNKETATKSNDIVDCLLLCVLVGIK